MQLRDRPCCEPMPVFQSHKISISLVFLEVPNVQIIMSGHIWIESSCFRLPAHPTPFSRCFECNVLGQLGKNRLEFSETLTDSLSTYLMSNGKYLNFILARQKYTKKS